MRKFAVTTCRNFSSFPGRSRRELSHGNTEDRVHHDDRRLSERLTTYFSSEMVKKNMREVTLITRIEGLTEAAQLRRSPSCVPLNRKAPEVCTLD